MTGRPTIDVYAELGVRPIINCQGHRTALGGSSPAADVMSAVEEANLSYVVMSELMEEASAYVAGLMGVEAAYITSGCAAALALSAAACIAGKDPDKRGRLPDTTGMKNEIVIQRKQRYGYDRSFTVVGARLVEAGDDSGCTAEQFEAAIGPSTAAVAYLVQAPDATLVSLPDAVDLAHAGGVPVIADAAAEIYPVDRFHANARSADLVCFGGKFFGAPNDTGFVCGDRELVEAAAEHGYVAFQTQTDSARAFGRPMKMDRHSIIALVAALRTWVTMDHEERLAQNEGRLSVIQRGLSGIAGVRTEIVDTDHYSGSSLHVVVDTRAVGMTAEEVAVELDAGEPRIWVVLGAGDVLSGKAYLHNEGLPADTFVINAQALNEGEDEVVADRVRKVLTGG